MSDPWKNVMITALERRLAIIGDHALRASDPASQLAQLQDVSEEIERLSVTAPADLGGHLRHYLERRSLDKALAELKAQA